MRRRKLQRRATVAREGNAWMVRYFERGRRAPITGMFWEWPRALADAVSWTEGGV